MGRPFAGVLSGFLLLLLSPSAGVVSVVNPSFELDTGGTIDNLKIMHFYESAIIPGWTSADGDPNFASPGDIEIWEDDGDPTMGLPSTFLAADGHHYVQLDPEDDPNFLAETLSQLITGLDPLKTYAISLSLRGSVRVLTESGFHKNFTNDLDEWVKVSTTFVPSANGNTNLRLRGRDSGAFVDWVDLQVIPEPSTAALLLVGLAMLGNRRRLRA